MRDRLLRSLRTRPTRVLALLGALAVASSAGAPLAFAAARYPAAVRHVFVHSCANSAISVSNGKVTRARAVRYCKLALVCISKKLSYKQFRLVVLNMQSGAPNPKARVLTQCAKSSAHALVP